MARNHARWQIGSLSSDPELRALTPHEKLAYWFIIQDTYLNPAGVIIMCPESWAEDLGMSEPEMDRALEGLHEQRFVVKDHKSHELLVRSFIRWDGIADQPNVLKQSLEHARRIKSPHLRRALAAELRRLPPAPAPKQMKNSTKVMYYPDPHACADEIEVPGTPPQPPSSKASRKGSAETSQKGVQTAFPEPSGVGDGVGESVPSGGSSVQKRSRRKPEIEIPDTWRPNENHRQQAAKSGLDVQAEAGKFRNHAKSHDRRLADWDAGFRNWLTKASEYRPGLRAVSGGNSQGDPRTGVVMER